MYHLGISRSEIDQMTDDEWASHFAILSDIRNKEAAANPFIRKKH